jgi:hypothetical protein
MNGRLVLVEIINDIEKKAEQLTPLFGKQINNPLLRNMDLSNLIVYSIKNHIYKSWKSWDTAIQKNKVRKGDKQLLRATVVHVNNTIIECLEGKNNSKSDQELALYIGASLDKMLKIIDSVNIYGE